ncbi:hypothetical protein [uncultured Slackia sp.]|uniref:hypothetical protein n=1 Tax=uncultured Slackia sp. TaxID=665903 RepID=UPI00280AFD09|nr:hypothetical protein [uncultured Slackia sp.]
MFCRQFYLNEIGRTINWEIGYYQHLRLITQERDFYRKSIQYTINEPFGQTVIPESRKNVIFETLTNWRHANIDHNMRFLVETFSKLECEILNDWLRSERETDLTQWTNDLLSIVPVKLYKAMLIPPSDKKTKS